MRSTSVSRSDNHRTWGKKNTIGGKTKADPHITVFMGLQEGAIHIQGHTYTLDYQVSGTKQFISIRKMVEGERQIRRTIGDTAVEEFWQAAVSSRSEGLMIKVRSRPPVNASAIL